MTRLTIRSEKELQVETLDALEVTRLKGALAPVYLQIANGEAALQAYLHMEAALRVSSLSLREIEAIKLLVSQHNRCDYCLSVHTVKSKAAGLSIEDQLAIRRGDTLEDVRLSTLVSIGTQLLKTPGTLAESVLNNAKEVGIDERQMVDIALAISTITFTNLFNHFNDSKPPFAAAPSID